MAGGMTRRPGRTLAERSQDMQRSEGTQRSQGAQGGGGPEQAGDPSSYDGAATVAAACHVWVDDAPGRPGRSPGLLVEWRRARQGWEGRVVYLVDDPTGSTGGQERVEERWLPAACLSPADGR